MRHIQSFVLILGGTLAFLFTQCRTTSTTTNNTTEVVSAAYNYTDHVKPVMERFCVGCHWGDSPAAGVDLTTYENVKQQANEHNMLKRIHSKSMPMSPEGPMPTKALEIIDVWAANNYPLDSTAMTLK